MTHSTADPATTHIAFIGLGIMGEPMARNLLAAGYRLTVHNRSRAVVDRLAEAGARPASDPADAAKDADVAILMLPDTPDVERIVEGPQGAAETLRRGATLIDMSTISAEATQALAGRLAERGIAMLDAPVSGGQTGAIQGNLTIMVGGAEDAFTAARPIFEVLGASVRRIGDSGAGQVAKACNQVVIAGAIQSVAEALTLARRRGVDAEAVREALLGGFAGSRILEVHGLRMLQQDFTPGFKARLHAKDLDIALSAAADSATPLPVTALVRQLLTALEASGRGDADHSALAEVLATLVGASTSADADPHLGGGSEQG
jgi:2-hydroxy-3-oxopropionate reductase